MPRRPFLPGRRRAVVSRGVRRLALATVCAGALAAFAPGILRPAHAADVLESQKCSGCHQLTPPDASQRTLSAYAERKGPDLFYAGNKFREEWLRSWLRAPERIRPAGLAPYRHVRSVDGKDELDPKTLTDHPKVSRRKLDAVVAALRKLDWGRERLPESLPSAPPVPRMLAEMNFVKFKGCASCHRVAPDFGGISGPELYTAVERLQPAFLASYIAAPQAWDPVAPMPGYDLPDPEVAKLIRFLQLVNEEYHDASTR